MAKSVLKYDLKTQDNYSVVQLHEMELYWVLHIRLNTTSYHMERKQI